MLARLYKNIGEINMSGEEDNKRLNEAITNFTMAIQLLNKENIKNRLSDEIIQNLNKT